MPLMLWLLFGEEMGSDSLEQPALFLHLLLSRCCCCRGVAAGWLHWKDMGSKSRLEMPAAGGQRSSSSSACGGERLVPLWTLSGLRRASLARWPLWPSLLRLRQRLSLPTRETASLVERGRRGQYAEGSAENKHLQSLSVSDFCCPLIY